ncbi:unnamed protein product [Linum trigynum]|uniref:Uncharacterized protein n=1 Tax=Linum trigynum TaxID=586398 RepID=A0AAV2CXE0_9ROSI
MLHHPLPPPSPTSSSVSSSDLDTESTGSFFHDRSTTLGTLMGVTFPAAAGGGPPSTSDQLQSTHQFATPAGTNPNSNSRKQRRARKRKIPPAPRPATAAAERRRRWWSLCRDAEAKPAYSLGEFLEVERRYGDAAFFNAEEEAAAAAAGAEVEGGFVGRALFADGRVLPPAEAVGGGGASSSAVRGALSRFPVSLTGICSGGVG